MKKMRCRLVVGLGLMSALLVAGSGLAIVDAVAGVAAFGENTAYSTRDFATQDINDAQSKATATASMGNAIASNAAATAQAVAALELGAVGSGHPDCTVNLVDGFSGTQHGIAMLCQGAHQDLGL